MEGWLEGVGKQLEQRVALLVSLLRTPRFPQLHDESGARIIAEILAKLMGMYGDVTPKEAESWVSCGNVIAITPPVNLGRCKELVATLACAIEEHVLEARYLNKQRDYCEVRSIFRLTLRQRRTMQLRWGRTGKMLRVEDVVAELSRQGREEKLVAGAEGQGQERCRRKVDRAKSLAMEDAILLYNIAGLARRVGCHRTTLAGSRRFMAWVRSQRQAIPQPQARASKAHRENRFVNKTSTKAETSRPAEPKG